MQTCHIFNVPGTKQPFPELLIIVTHLHFFQDKLCPELFQGLNRISPQTADSTCVNLKYWREA